MKSSFRETSIRILRIFTDDRDMPEEKVSCDVRSVIDDARRALSMEGEQIGVWESAELNAADCALAAGFPQLALVFAAKAWAVSRLGESEYAYGLNMLRQEGAAGGKIEQSQEQATFLRESAAANILAAEKKSAAGLLVAQEKVAMKLSLSQEAAAVALRAEQQAEALNLADQNLYDADCLAAESLQEMQRFSDNEAKRNTYQRELEQIISQGFGGYSVDSQAPATESFSGVIYHDRGVAAIRLKKHQQVAAEKLREVHGRVADSLAQSARTEADNLKEAQRQTAIEVVEQQIVRALRKKIADAQAGGG